MKFKYIFITTLTLIIINICLNGVYSEDSANEDSVKNTGNNDEKSAPSPKISTHKRGEIPTLEEFEPSEEVSADKPVAFPIDI